MTPEEVLERIRWCRTADAARTVLAENGYVIVPREPTEEMVDSGMASTEKLVPVVTVYRAMISAVTKE